MKNLTPEELVALEEKKARAAQAIVAARERAAIAAAKKEFEQKKQEWKKNKAYVKGSKVCEANRIYEEKGWYICEVCDKKLQDIEWVEEHVQSDKHKRNMEWYGSDKTGTCGNFSENEFVDWDEHEMIYRCTLCDAKAACEAVLQAHLSGKEHAKRLANREWYADQGKTVSNSHEKKISEGDACVPAYCRWDATDGRFVCVWCDKRADGIEMLQVHLQGNEHSKKCSNIGIPAYGENGHMEESSKYFKEHGANLWARQSHWPEFVLDEPTCWNCSMCRKKFITPVAVNEHLKDKHSGRKSTVLVVERARPKPVIDFDFQGEEFECDLCYIPFPSRADLERHETQDPGHQQVLRRLAETTSHTAQAPLVDFDI